MFLHFLQREPTFMSLCSLPRGRMHFQSEIYTHKNEFPFGAANSFC